MKQFKIILIVIILLYVIQCDLEKQKERYIKTFDFIFDFLTKNYISTLIIFKYDKYTIELNKMKLIKPKYTNISFPKTSINKFKIDKIDFTFLFDLSIKLFDHTILKQKNFYFDFEHENITIIKDGYYFKFQSYFINMKNMAKNSILGNLNYFKSFKKGEKPKEISLYDDEAGYSDKIEPVFNYMKNFCNKKFRLRFRKINQIINLLTYDFIQISYLFKTPLITNHEIEKFNINNIIIEPVNIISNQNSLIIIKLKGNSNFTYNNISYNTNFTLNYLNFGINENNYTDFKLYIKWDSIKLNSIYTTIDIQVFINFFKNIYESHINKTIINYYKNLFN